MNIFGNARIRLKRLKKTLISKVEWSDPSNGLHLVLSAMDCPIWIVQLYTFLQTPKMFPDMFFGGNSFHTNPIVGQEGMFLEVFFHATMAQVSFQVACPWLSPRFRRNSQQFSERRVSKSKLRDYHDFVHFPPGLPSFLPLDIYFLPSGVLFFSSESHGLNWRGPIGLGESWRASWRRAKVSDGELVVSGTKTGTEMWRNKNDTKCWFKRVKRPGKTHV